MTIERKTFTGADFKVLSFDEGIAEMIVSVFHNVDGAQEIVMPGFFAESIASRRTSDGRPRAKGVWSHDWESPVAKTLDAKELLPGDPLLPPHLADLGGLWVQGQFNMETQRGREAFSDLKFGAIDEFSIGYSVTRAEFDSETGVRKLLKGEWYEWSPVLVGMNDQTALLGVKGESDDIPEGLQLNEEHRLVLLANQRHFDRLASHLTWLMEKKEGRVLSEATRARIRSHLESAISLRSGLGEHIDGLEALLTETEPAKAAPDRSEIEALFLESLHIHARLNGVAV